MKSNNEKLRVTMLAPTIAVGGIATWLRILLKYSDIKKIVYEVLDTSKLYDPFGRKYNLRGIMFGLRDAFLQLMRLVKNLAIFKPNVVYFTCAPSAGYATRDIFFMFMLNLLNVPTIAHLRGGNIEGFWGGNKFRKFIVISALKTCRAILVITREMEEKGKIIFSADKIIYFPNMIDDISIKNIKDHPRNFEPTGSIKLLHVGWQCPEKGSFDLVEAMKDINSHVTCDLVGTAAPEYEMAIEARIDELGIKDRIKMVGQKTGNDIVEAFNKADIFVFPTHREGPEGFPNVILEAMACGLPIIANEVGNIREMIGADTESPAGLLLDNVDPVDPREIADKIEKLIAAPELRSNLSKNGILRVKEYYVASKVAPALEELLYDIFHPTKKASNRISV